MKDKAPKTNRRRGAPGKGTVRVDASADPKAAAKHLNAATKKADEPAVFLLALRHIAEAHGGLAKVAKAAGIRRESLYRALSPKGNPTLSTLKAITAAMDLKLAVTAA